ncbi:MAG: hypothetical protein ABR589_00125 [Chthoniobacterales bacterium]
MPDWVVTVTAVYTIQYVFCALFGAGKIPELLRPFRWFPAYLYQGWDGTIYRRLYEHFDLFVWPPLYPYTLRLVTGIFRFGPPDAFEKSAVVLNLISHLVIAWALTVYVKNDARLKGVAPWLVVFLLFFYPGHNVFFAAYSESYYVALTAVAFVLRQKERIGWGSVIAGVSALVRMMGTFLVAALFVEQVFYCLRDRRIHWRPLLATSSGLLVAASWHVALAVMGTSQSAAGAGWVRELIETHVAAGTNPKVWVFTYLAFSWRIETIAFWLSIIAIVYCAVKKRYMEMFYIALFNFSLIVYLHRPFGWTRYVSVLLPIYIMMADVLKNRPRLACVVVASIAAASCFVEMELFLGNMGEP